MTDVEGGLDEPAELEPEQGSLRLSSPDDQHDAAAWEAATAAVLRKARRLGEDDPDAITERLRRAARPFRLKGEQIQPVYELIVTVADPSPGPDGDYSHDIAADRVELVLDLLETARQ